MIEQSKDKRLWQKRPLSFGFLLLLGLFLLFLILLVLVEKFSKPSQGTISVASGFSFGNKVAILNLEGIITQSEPTLKQLRAYLKNDSIKAVVLRVDSPGGAVAPTQEIYMELKRFVQKKPVVASMATVSASGGYYVCLPCNYIYAVPGTITGSIGVLMQFMDIEELLRWMKIKEEVIKSGRFKDAGSPYRPLSPEERRYFEYVIQNVHQQFKNALRESRKLSPEQIEKVSDGRIFTGEIAKELGLVDELGNLEDAIKKAGELAGIKGEPEVIWPRRRMGFFEELGSELADVFFKELLKPFYYPVWYLETGLIKSQARSEK